MAFSFYFVAVLTLLFIFDGHYNALLSVVAIVIHESAHILTLVLLGGRPKEISLSLCELNICAEDKCLTPARRFLVAVSGPAANILLGLFLFPFFPSFANVNLILGFFQLLPVTSLDGDHALDAVAVGGRIRKILSLCIAFCTALLGFLILLHTRYNFSVLAVSLYLIFLTLCERRCNIG